MNDDPLSKMSPRFRRVLEILEEHGGDAQAVMAAHPEISFDDLKQAVMEAAGIPRSPVARIPAKGLKPPSAWKRTGKQTYQIKITLRGSKPPIWRRVVVPGELTLARLHEVIQAAMGWTNSHLHMFQISGQAYSMPDEDMPGDELDDRKYRLCDLIQAEKSKFAYGYDFGDDWQHDLLIEKITPGKADVQCIAGKRRCPPEDCGGVWGYSHLLEVLANPQDEEYAERLEWIGESIDPEQFNLDDVNNALKQIRF